jgi:sulfate permease, SulP family
MDISTDQARRQHQPTFTELFTPKLVTLLREGYKVADLRDDALAGLTVAIVALPLSMAIAIASGTTPDRGLITAVVGGFLVSALAASRSAAPPAPSSCWWRRRSIVTVSMASFSRPCCPACF